MFRKALILIAAFFLTSPAIAQDDVDAENLQRLQQRTQDIVAVLNQEMSRDDVFADIFNAQVSEAQLHGLFEQMTGQYGPLIGVESIDPVGNGGGARIQLRFEQAIAHGQVQLEPDDPYEVIGFVVQRFEPINAEGLSIEEQLAELPGVTNLLMERLDGSQTVFAHNADQPLAIGSTFKLYVLSALVQEIAAGRRSWSDVVTLTERSFPSGQMQDWPLGSPVTLHTLATLMISISDNTATDQLMAVLGREAVEAELRASGHSDPALTLPFLTTREMFVIKMGDDQSLDEYLALAAPERLAVLQQLPSREIELSELMTVFGDGPRFIDIEWHASPRDITRIYQRLIGDEIALDILGVNKGISTGSFEGWEYVGYKGGSEPGVLNFSWLLRDEAGEYSVLSMSWNNPEEAVSELVFIGLAQSALSQVRSASQAE